MLTHFAANYGLMGLCTDTVHTLCVFTTGYLWSGKNILILLKEQALFLFDLCLCFTLFQGLPDLNTMHQQLVAFLFVFSWLGKSSVNTKPTTGNCRQLTATTATTRTLPMDSTKNQDAFSRSTSPKTTTPPTASANNQGTASRSKIQCSVITIFSPPLMSLSVSGTKGESAGQHYKTTTTTITTKTSASFSTKVVAAVSYLYIQI